MIFLDDPVQALLGEEAALILNDLKEVEANIEAGRYYPFPKSFYEAGRIRSYLRNKIRNWVDALQYIKKEASEGNLKPALKQTRERLAELSSCFIPPGPGMPHIYYLSIIADCCRAIKYQYILNALESVI